MSSLLEQAIIDAKMLKETAMKNAEAAILEQYAEEIKQNMDMLLEADDGGDDLAALMGGADSGGGGLGSADMGGGDMGAAPAAASPVGGMTNTSQAKPSVQRVMNRIPASYLGESSEQIEINLDSLVLKAEQLQEEMKFHLVDREEEGAMTFANDGAGYMEEEPLEETGAEDLDRAKSNLARGINTQAQDLMQHKNKTPLAEITHIDMKIVRPGGVGTQTGEDSEMEKQHAVRSALVAQVQAAHRAHEMGETEEEEHEEHELEEENIEEELATELVKASFMHEELKKEHAKTLKALQEAKKIVASTREKLNKSVELNTQLREGVEYLSGKVNETNLVNARLLYTNKVLGNVSLNERQKSQIAEAVSKARSVEEAKVIYETTQRTAGAGVERNKAPQSLTEALNKGPSPFLPRAAQPTRDPMTDRMKLLAGIKK
jgi:hypothetical protein